MHSIFITYLSVRKYVYWIKKSFNIYMKKEVKKRF